MEHYKFIIALSILIISFVSKLVIGRSFTEIDWVKACIELPVNVFFLSLSLLCAYTLTSEGELKNTGFVSVILYILIAIFVILIWRYVEKLSEAEIGGDGKKGKRKWHWLWILLWVINFFISAGAIYYPASLLLSRDIKTESTEIGKSNIPLDSNSLVKNTKQPKKL
jgi:hypothetical protein